MARTDWDIHGIIVYKELSKDSPFYGKAMDIYDYSFFENYYIPIYIIKRMLKISDQKFVDILNEDNTSKKHLITNYEEQFRAERTTTYGYKSLFTKEQVFGGIPDLSVELADFEDWLDDNYELLKENRVIHEESSYRQEYDTMKARIAELEAELVTSEAKIAKLRAENEELKNVPLRGGEDGEKVCTRERETFLKIIRACLAERGTPLERGLAGKLERRTIDLYGEGKLSEDTIKRKLNEMEKIPIIKS